MNEVDLTLFRLEFIEAEKRLREERSALRDRLWREREELRELLEREVPMMSRFHHLLADLGDVVGAINTGCLPALEREGYVKNDAKFVTADLLKRGGRVWSLRWIAPHVLGVDRSTSPPRAANQWNEVVLQVKIDRDKQKLLDVEEPHGQFTVQLAPR